MSKQEMQEMAESVVTEILEDFETFDSCVLSVDPIEGDEAQGLEILRTFGGPTVWVDTRDSVVHAHEQGAHATAGLPSTVSAYLESYYTGQIVG